MTVRASSASGSAITPSSVSVPSGGAIDLYNLGGPGEANYERLRANWNSNIAQLFVSNAGIGTQRNLRIGIAGANGATAPEAWTNYSATAIPVISHNPAGGNTAGIWHELCANTTNFSASSGNQTAVAISPTFAQTGTAAAHAFTVNGQGTAGSGGMALQVWQRDTSVVSYIHETGNFYTSAAVCGVTGLFLGSSIGSTDVGLWRDAAGTFGQRNGPVAQTFNIYNTWTDAANYERVTHAWAGDIYYILQQYSGTGAPRVMAIGTAGASYLNFMTNNTVVWQFTPTGHLYPGADNTYDIGISGQAARNGFFAGYVTHGSVLVANLPAAPGGNARCFVSDSSVVAAGNFGAVVAGGGANTVPVYYDGVNWRIG